MFHDCALFCYNVLLCWSTPITPRLVFGVQSGGVLITEILPAAMEGLDVPCEVSGFIRVRVDVGQVVWSQVTPASKPAVLTCL